MTLAVQSAPAFLAGDAQAIMELSNNDINNACQFKHYNKQPNCDIPLYIGVFFDGTNNNRERDEPVRSHTNIVRLYNAHKSMSSENRDMRKQGHYAIYVPGVGTRFPENEEWRESMEGKSMGKGCQARILYAVLEVFNAVHRAFSENIRFLAPDEITALLRDYVQRVEQGMQSADGETPAQRESRAAWMRRLTADLTARIARARNEKLPPHIPFIRVNVFGFSRGAAQARSFCYHLNDALVDGALAGMPLQIGFVGLFDCVPSVGLSDATRRSIPVLGFADGHFGWAREILGELPAIARCTVHMVGAHEQRLNFPLTRVNGHNVTEIVYPGVHSDVGGGYQARDHGRAATEDRLLSQVPLAHMHRLARRWDVPLVDWAFMGKDWQADYNIHPELVSHWNDYMQTADADWQLREGQDKPRMGESADFAALVHLHRRLHLSFRRRYRPAISMEWLLDSLPINTQDREDIESYNALLTGDLDLLFKRRKAIAEKAYRRTAARGAISLPPVQITDALARTSNYMPQWLTRMEKSPEDDEIAWALQQFEGEPVRGTGHMALLIHQVHDSLACFSLMGYATGEDKAEKLLAIVREGRAKGRTSLEPYEREVFDRYEMAIKTDSALTEMIDGRLRKERDLARGATDEKTIREREAKYSKESVFRPDEQARVEPLFRLQTDAYASTLPNGIENVVRIVTKTRREAGGYLLPRAFFK